MRVVIVYESLFGNTRRIAEAIAEGMREAAPEAQVSCVRDWFIALPKAADGSLGAAFDTHADSCETPTAAHSIARLLRGHGYELVAEPEGFVIDKTEGPLRGGERDRAKAWGASLLRQPVR